MTSSFDRQFGSQRPNPAKAVALLVFTGILVLIGLFILFGSWLTVDEGEMAVVTRVGKVDRTLGSGFHWKTPFVENATYFSVRTEKIETESTAASKDLQDVTANIAVQYSLSPDSVSTIYSKYQREKNLRSRTIDPAIQDAVKAATAQFDAVNLVQNRPAVKEAIENILRERFSGEGITLINVDIINFSFSESFTKAIEEKVTAQQNADREENKLRQVQFEADQRVAQAEGEAQAIKIQAEAIQSQGGSEYVKLQWIEAWRQGGAQVPKFMGDSGSNFLLDLSSI